MFATTVTLGAILGTAEQLQAPDRAVLGDVGLGLLHVPAQLTATFATGMHSANLSFIQIEKTQQQGGGGEVINVRPTGHLRSFGSSLVVGTGLNKPAEDCTYQSVP